MKARCLILLCCGLIGCQGPPPSWEVVTSDDTGWIVALTASAGRVLAVGGQPGSIGQPGVGTVTIVRGSGSSMQVQRMPSPRPGMLWWAHGLSDEVAWLAGENGSVLRYDEGTGAPRLTVVSTPTAAVLYGIWAFSDDDVWAVGGDEGQPGVVLHGGAGGLIAATGVPATPTLYKIYGADPQHLFAVGSDGTLLRLSGGQWTVDPPLTPRNETLFTVHGRSAADVYAVGGLGQGRVLHFDGQSWSLLGAEGLSGLSGVFAAPDAVLIAGQQGLVAEGNGPGPFQPVTLPTTLDLHAVFASQGDRYAAGGNLSQFGISPPKGVLLHGTQ